jgi:penicillin-binding protein 2
VSPSHPFHPHSRRRRAGLATLLIGTLVCSLGSAYFRTQIIQNDDYTLRSDDNRLRVITIPAPRGAVYDRNGELIAETVTTYMLFLDTPAEDSTRAGLAALKPALQLSDSVVAALLAQREKQPAEPLLISKDLSFEQVSWVEEHRAELPRLTLEPLPQRRYMEGEAVAHLVGYTAEISERELADSTKWVGYKAGQLVGKSGIEKQYEAILGGHPGERYVEVDARGKVIGMLAPEEAKKPVAGKDIRLTIDLELQRFAHSIFPEGKNGAIVAMVPSTGEILALYSHPTFDPNELIEGISPQLWTSLNTDPRRPLLNRATAGIYPPASTFKLATALIGLERGVITPETKMPYPCSGGMSYAGRYSRCWKKEGHGALDLAGAIQNSCNVYFYQLGIWLGLSQLTAEGTRLGFSRPTGIDLPSEKAGTFPAGTEWYRKRFGWTPTPSEVMSLAIGQGPNAQTPLRVAQFYSALAGNGTAAAPHLMVNAPNARRRETDLRVGRQALLAVRLGMARVTEPGGTAYMSSLKRWKLYGKTGTGQNSGGDDHAWFAGFAGPIGGEPEIAVSVIVEFGEHGSSAAAPLAAKVADFYLNKKHGLTTDPAHQTLAERLGVRAE